MRVRFWGTRGSFAMSGQSFLRYGGNTTCIELLDNAGSRLVIDLGTGATELAKQLMKTEFGKGKGRLNVLLSHTHLDHIQGLPFFTPFFIPGNRIRILGADPGGASLETTLQNQLAPHYSPLEGLENLAADVTIDSIVPGASLSLDGFEVQTAAVPHGNMWTTALRISADGHVVAFLSDVEYPQPEAPLAQAIAIAQDADLLIHDAMHSDLEYSVRRGWGHSPVAAAQNVANAAGAKRLVLFHHSPDATDAMIDAMVAAAQQESPIPVFAAAEGNYLEL
ncbi:MAG TPA: MBL fold metallo-hydrolase [Kofleriaceae bacterium]|nr:MBL fold metallo-hydrolase [Kofleriaceae bacterium]